MGVADTICTESKMLDKGACGRWQMYVNHMHFCVVSVLLSSVFLGVFFSQFFWLFNGWLVASLMILTLPSKG